MLEECVSVFPIASADAAGGSCADPHPTVQAQVTTTTAAAAAILDRIAIIPAWVVCVIRPALRLSPAAAMVVLLLGVVALVLLQRYAFQGRARVRPRFVTGCAVRPVSHATTVPAVRGPTVNGERGMRVMLPQILV